ncbi:MAG: hypothetical protein OXB88_02550 [Bacteriovoracales bacterium]|nr:hypothetical protein [Bacteriovoracales bacterium]
MFKKIDDVIGRALSTFQEGPFYSKVMDAFDDLDEDLRKVLGRWFGLIITLSPICICLYLFIVNFSKNSNVEIKKEILKLSTSFIENQKQIKQSSSKFISSREISGEKDLVDIISKMTSGSDISTTSFSLENFKKVSLGEDFMKISAKVNFTKVSLPFLVTVFKDLLEKSNIRVVDVKMEKEKENEVSGFFNVTYYSEMILREGNSAE